MKHLSILFRTIWKSVSSLTYYRDVVKASFSFSFKYFLAFSVMLGLALTVSVSVTILPTVTTFTQRLAARAPNLFPPDLVITVTDGQLSTNVAEPLHFPIPYELFIDTPPAISDQKQLYLVTIDTGARAADLSDSQSLILVTKNSVVVKDEGSYRIFPLREVDDVIIDKQIFTEFFATLKPLLTFIPLLMVLLLVLVFTLLLPLSRLLSLVILTFVLLLATKLMHVSLSYGKLFQIGLHALTLPTLIQVTMAGFGLVPPIPFFNSILFLLYCLVILADLRKSSIALRKNN